MILECPNCETRYEIPVDLPPEGRKVRCASCKNVWTATPPASEITLPDFEDEEIVFKEGESGEPAPAQEVDPAAAVEQAIAESEPAPEAPESGESDAASEDVLGEAFAAAIENEADSGSPEPGHDEDDSPPIVIGKAKKRRGPVLGNMAAGWAALALVLTGVMAFATLQRVSVVRALPGAASAYESVGLPVNVRGLAFENVKYSWETSAGRPVLEVYGDIVNITGKPLKVPTVVFGLRTKEKVEVYQWAADVRADLLPPGERTAFTAQIPTPPKSIRDVQVRFAKVR